MGAIIKTARRWLRYPNQRLYEWQSYPQYWFIHNKFIHISFWFKKQIAKIRYKGHELFESSRVIKELVQTIFGTFIFSMALIVVLLLIEDLLNRHLWTDFFAKNLLQTNAYTNFLGTIAQIGAVFLGLYFTAVSVVASTVYSNVSEDVRSLLINEKVGNIYIKIVILLTSTAILLLVLDVGGLTPSAIGLFVIFILSVFSVLSFVVLGKRILYFFSPKELINILVHDIRDSVSAATPSGLYWKDYSFQVHNQKKAEARLDTYQHIVDQISSRKYPESKILMELGIGLERIIEDYANAKFKIPNDSHWFKRTYKHKDWLTTDYTEIELALRTGTSVHPKSIPDRMWWEEHIQNIIKGIIIALLKNKETETVGIIIYNIQRGIEYLGERFLIDEAIFILHNISSPIWLELDNKQKYIEIDKGNINEIRNCLGLLESQTILLTSLILGFSRAMHELSTEMFQRNVDRIYSKRLSSIYAAPMPNSVIKEIERLHRGVQLERAIEGKSISKKWYTRQIIALAYAKLIEKTIQTFLMEFKTNYSERANKFINDKSYFYVQELAHRGLEAIEKFKFCIKEARSCYSRLESFKKTTDSQWPNVDWDKYLLEIQQIRKIIIELMAKSSVPIASKEIPENLPDYFGHSYSFLAEECYNAMATDEEAFFSKIFPVFFVLSLAAYQRLRTRLINEEQQTQLVFSTEPIEDILALSGLALIYSELNDMKYWRLVQNLWDDYFAALPNAAEVMQLLIATFDYRSSLIAIKPRDAARYSWRQDISSRFQKQGLSRDYGYIPGFGSAERTNRHKSPIIRALSRNIHFHEDPQDVFLVCYLLKRPEALSLEFPKHAKSFAESLRREINGDVPDGDLTE